MAGAGGAIGVSFSFVLDDDSAMNGDFSPWALISNF